MSFVQGDDYSKGWQGLLLCEQVVPLEVIGDGHVPGALAQFFGPLLILAADLRVGQGRREYNISGLKPCGYQVPFQPSADAVSSEPGLLKPPRIEIAVLDDHIAILNGQVEELIQFWAWGDFGPLDVSVNIFYTEGELLEGDYAEKKKHS